MNYFKFIVPTIIMISAASQAQQMIITQEELVQRGLQSNAEASSWVKPEAGVAYRIPSDLRQVPDFIRNNLGSVDAINNYIANPADHYTSIDQYLTRNAGSVVSLQFNNGKVDFYVIGADTYRTTYIEVPKNDGLSNQKLVGKLDGAMPGFERFLTTDPNVIGVKKVAVVYLVKASSLGFEAGKEFVVQAPAHWGDNQTQTKPAGQEGYIAFEIIKQGEIRIVAPYLINETSVRLNNGTVVSRPIGYVPSDELKLLVDRNGTGKMADMPATLQGKAGFNVDTGRVVVPQLFGYLPENNSGKSLRMMIGQVAQIKTAQDVVAERAAKAALGSGTKTDVNRAVEAGRKAR